MIVLDEKNRVFTLHTCATTYQMKADSHQVLLHTYYGPRVGNGDLSYLIRHADRGFSPNPSGTGPHLFPGYPPPGVRHLRGGGLPDPLPGGGAGGRQPP